MKLMLIFVSWVNIIILPLKYDCNVGEKRNIKLDKISQPVCHIPNTRTHHS